MNSMVNIKGRNKGLELVYNIDADFNNVLLALQEKLEVAKEFFRGSAKPVNIFLPKGYKISPEHTNNLTELVSRYNLSYLPSIQEKIVPAESLVEQEVNLRDVLAIDSNNLSLVKAENEEANAIKKWSLESENCLIVYKTLRGGQEISYCGSIVIVGDVNPTARVFAEGNIVISGINRGYLHAGVFGNIDAHIIAKDFLGGQLRIANYIAVAPENSEISKLPQRAVIRNGSIEVEVLENGGR